MGQKWVKNGFFQKFGQFGVPKQGKSAHFEPIALHVGPSKVTKWRENGLFCDPSTLLWATSDFVPRSEALRTPHTARVKWPIHHLWANSDFVPRSETLGTPHPAGVK